MCTTFASLNLSLLFNLHLYTNISLVTRKKIRLSIYAHTKKLVAAWALLTLVSWQTLPQRAGEAQE